jgi:glutathione peroxidase
MKRLFFLASIVALLAAFTGPVAKNVYAFKVPSLEGGQIDFAKFKGKKILIVNTASECQYTVQYGALQNLYASHKDKLVVVGFPSNEFKQETANEEEIQKFCKTRYGVTFPMSTKTEIKGDSMAPIFKWLSSKKLNGVMDADIKWNFGKFLIDEKGKLIAYFPSNVKPDSEEIAKYLK